MAARALKRTGHGTLLRLAHSEARASSRGTDKSSPGGMFPPDATACSAVARQIHRGDHLVPGNCQYASSRSAAPIPVRLARLGRSPMGRADMAPDPASWVGADISLGATAVGGQPVVAGRRLPGWDWAVWLCRHR